MLQREDLGTNSLYDACKQHDPSYAMTLMIDSELIIS